MYDVSPFREFKIEGFVKRKKPKIKVYAEGKIKRTPRSYKPDYTLDDWELDTDKLTTDREERAEWD